MQVDNSLFPGNTLGFTAIGANVGATNIYALNHEVGHQSRDKEK